MRITGEREDPKFTYATITMSHGLRRCVRIARRNGTVQIACLAGRRKNWRQLRPELAETIRRAFSLPPILAGGAAETGPRKKVLVPRSGCTSGSNRTANESKAVEERQ
jgi:hypothetical protein